MNSLTVLYSLKPSSYFNIHNTYSGIMTPFLYTLNFTLLLFQQCFASTIPNCSISNYFVLFTDYFQISRMYPPQHPSCLALRSFKIYHTDTCSVILCLCFALDLYPWKKATGNHYLISISNIHILSPHFLSIFSS